MMPIVDHGQIWDDCLLYISHRIKKQSFATWLKHTTAATDGNGGILIQVPNQFVAEWVGEHYHDIIDAALVQVCGQTIPFSLVVGGTVEMPQTELGLSTRMAASPPPVQKILPGMLNDRYTFDKLVVGNFNQFPYAAAMAVAQAPGLTQYNPLYIYGGVGLGKTHLVQAIAHHILHNDPTKKIIYATSEKFTSDFINSISSNTTTNFMSMYRGVDVLVIDDAQFFAGKESTQEQFFHTFNALYNAAKQIVLTSDRAPKDIKGMEERLLSRFSCGLVTDIQPPDLETRMAILQRKIETENIAIGEDVISYIANSITSNIRELEGSLIRLLAYASLKNEQISPEMARRVLSDTFGSRRQPVSVEQVKKTVAEAFEIKPEMMTAKKKTQHIALARQVAMYLARVLTGNSLKAVGEAFGGRDHSTVIHACSSIERLIKEDPDFRQRVEAISRMITG